MKRQLLAGLGLTLGFIGPAAAIAPVPWSVINQVAQAIDVTCPAQGSSVPSCYVRMLFYFTPSYPFTACYTVPNKPTGAINSPLPLSLLMPQGNMTKLYPFTLRSGLLTCP